MFVILSMEKITIKDIRLVGVKIRKFKLPIDTPLSFVEVEMTKENDV